MSRLMLTVAMLAALGACSAAAGPAEQMAPAPPAALASEPVLASEPAEPAAKRTPHATAHAVLAADVRCSIRTRRTANGVEFEAFARSGAPAMGEFEFVITKDDAGGSSDIVQGGAFDLGEDDSQSLGLSEISIERGGRYRARLVLSDSDGVICREEVRS